MGPAERDGTGPQGEKLAERIASESFGDGGRGPGRKGPPGQPDRLWPVSYTHLDVYKRQPGGGAGRGMISRPGANYDIKQSGSPGCLYE